ncbi:MAG: hypothetical protein ABI867_37360 [Kofleriaceae bacterium]
MRPRLICSVLALVACNNTTPKVEPSGSGSATPGSAAPETSPTVKHYNPEMVRMEAPPIELPKQEAFLLRDAGKGTKAPLRYALAPGVIEYRTETRLATRQLDKGAFSATTKLPAMTDGFAITVTAGQPLALRALVAEIAGTKTDPVAEQYIASWRAKLQNRRIAVTTDPQGQFSTITFNDDPANQRSLAAKDELVQRLLAVMIPVPTEAVGTGAKWQVTTVLRQGPLYIKQTGTYTLVERTPAKWKLHVKLLRVGEEQTVSDAALPKGASVDLIALFRLLEGDVEVDPTRPLFATGTFTVESRLHAKVKMPGQETAEQFTEDTGTIRFTAK